MTSTARLTLPAYLSLSLCLSQVLLSQSYHHHVRLQCADYISRHRDDFKEVCTNSRTFTIFIENLTLSPQFLTVKLDEYLRRLRIGQLWGGEVELVVFSKMYRRSIVVYNQQVNQVQEQIFLTPEDEAAGRRTEELIDPVRVDLYYCQTPFNY